MKHVGILLVLLWMSTHLPACLPMALTNRTGDICPVLKTDGPHLRQIDKEHLKILGFDLAERFSLRQTSCGGEKLCYKLGGATLTKETQVVFPGGVPEEYSLVATFRVRRNTKKERWYLWQAVSQNGSPKRNSTYFDSQLGNTTTPVSKDCDADAPEDQCTITRTYLFLHKFWFFSAAYYFGNWAFIAVFLIGLVVSCCKGKKSVIEGEVDEEDSDLSEEELPYV